MRINHTKRILMNEEGASPGGGAAPPAPAEPSAAPTAPAPTGVSLDQVKGLMNEMLGGFKNEFFANARKAGLLGKDKSAPNDPPEVKPAPPSTAAPAPTGLTEDVLEARLEQERIVTRVQVENKLSDAAVKRMKSALKQENPADVAAWTASYLADLGLVRPTDPAPSTPATPPVPAVPNTAPISDRGSPAPNGAVGWRFELNNPIGMSPAARAQMDAELGVEKARKMRLEAARNQASQMKVAIGPKG